MIDIITLQTALMGVFLTVCSMLLAVWWQQQTYRWPLIIIPCLLLAPLLSWISATLFVVPDYRAGCDGLCLGFRGAPLSVFESELLGGSLDLGRFAVNSLLYLVMVLGWLGLVRGVVGGVFGESGSAFLRLLVWLLLVVAPLALGPVLLPAPEACARGDAQRVEINARREVFLYDHLAEMPVLRVGLEDVRPRTDGEAGMRVCFKTYTFFYLPAGHIFMDMAPEGVHSKTGGVLPPDSSCWR